ncbi:uncharacterized protein TRIVIDRAFT_63143 [Trichoderma virens Gv29-8]|uniref:Uncharacterized protein n=1 Tax=Hypocrea virens (strain Gv29-8 / FGSC 10586) TaxID=413071 RepID=G9ME93_HYPVG|nr:uncharacterized protein TRIVIDRAFT_63143 [Trichoderma virens Gv29-8]EHK27386.1 hypothetical protein TRIVIDRAFT_63143 [Trichoderma virens Gv29-8]
MNMPQARETVRGRGTRRALAFSLDARLRHVLKQCGRRFDLVFATPRAVSSAVKVPSGQAAPLFIVANPMRAICAWKSRISKPGAMDCDKRRRQRWPFDAAIALERPWNRWNSASRRCLNAFDPPHPASLSKVTLADPTLRRNPASATISQFRIPGH